MQRMQRLSSQVEEDAEAVYPRAMLLTASGGAMISNVSSDRGRYYPADVSASQSREQLDKLLNASSSSSHHAGPWHDDIEDVEVEQFDLALIYSEEDTENADRFKTYIETNIVLKNGKHPKICTVNHSLNHIQSKFHHADQAIQRSTLMFLYLSTHFCSDTWADMQKEECLMESIRNEKKRWCVVPVHTEAKRSASYTVPFGLSSLKGVDISKLKSLHSGVNVSEDKMAEYFIKNITSMLNKYLKCRLAREKKERHELRMKRMAEEHHESMEEKKRQNEFERESERYISAERSLEDSFGHSHNEQPELRKKQFQEAHLGVMEPLSRQGVYDREESCRSTESSLMDSLRTPHSMSDGVTITNPPQQGSPSNANIPAELIALLKDPNINKEQLLQQLLQNKNGMDGNRDDGYASLPKPGEDSMTSDRPIQSQTSEDGDRKGIEADDATENDESLLDNLTSLQIPVGKSPPHENADMRNVDENAGVVPNDISTNATADGPKNSEQSIHQVAAPEPSPCAKAGNASNSLSLKTNDKSSCDETLAKERKQDVVADSSELNVSENDVREVSIKTLPTDGTVGQDELDSGFSPENKNKTGDAENTVEAADNVLRPQMTTSNVTQNLDNEKNNIPVNASTDIETQTSLIVPTEIIHHHHIMYPENQAQERQGTSGKINIYNIRGENVRIVNVEGNMVGGSPSEESFDDSSLQPASVANQDEDDESLNDAQEISLDSSKPGQDRPNDHDENSDIYTSDHQQENIRNTAVGTSSEDIERHTQSQEGADDIYSGREPLYRTSGAPGGPEENYETNHPSTVSDYKEGNTSSQTSSRASLTTHNPPQLAEGPQVTMVTGIYTEDDGDMTSAMTQQTGQGHRSSVRGLDPTSSERVDDGASRSVRPTQRLTSQISQDRINSGQSTIDGAIRGSFVSSHQQTVASENSSQFHMNTNRYDISGSDAVQCCGYTPSSTASFSSQASHFRNVHKPRPVVAVTPIQHKPGIKEEETELKTEMSSDETEIKRPRCEVAPTSTGCTNSRTPELDLSLPSKIKLDPNQTLSESYVTPDPSLYDEEKSRQLFASSPPGGSDVQLPEFSDLCISDISEPSQQDLSENRTTKGQCEVRGQDRITKSHFEVRGQHRTGHSTVSLQRPQNRNVCNTDQLEIENPENNPERKDHCDFVIVKDTRCSNDQSGSPIQQRQHNDVTVPLVASVSKDATIKSQSINSTTANFDELSVVDADTEAGAHGSSQAVLEQRSSVHAESLVLDGTTDDKVQPGEEAMKWQQSQKSGKSKCVIM